MRILRHICFLIIVLVVFTILLSCSSEKQEPSFNSATNRNTKISDSNTNQFDVAEFKQNRELWTSKNIQNYKMIVSAQGFQANFPEEVLIEARNRQAKYIKSLSKTGRNYTEAYKNYDTVEKVFDFIEGGNKAYKMSVMFDKNLGYPNQVIYDGRADVADDELQLQVKSLEVIE